MNKTWETTVLVEAQPGYQEIPRKMQTQARTLLEAQAYFQTFGKVVAPVRQISG